MSRAPSGVVVSGLLDAVPVSLVRDAVQRVLTGEKVIASIAVTFVGKRPMRVLNRRYLKHDSVTDVISFALPQPGGAIAGDVYICRYAAARQARQHGVTTRTELVRLVIHGTLHVLGWDHPSTASARTASPMWKRQERYVKEFA